MRLKSALRRGVAAAVIAGIVVSSGIPAYAARWDIANGDITVKAGDTEGTNKVTQGETIDKDDTNTVITGESDKNTVTIDTSKGDVDVTFDDLKIDVSGKKEGDGSDDSPVQESKAAVTVQGDHDATIELDGDNELKSGGYNAGLEKNEHESKGTLTIKDDNDTKGALTAEGGFGGAGIGGGIVGEIPNDALSDDDHKVTGGSLTRYDPDGKKMEDYSYDRRTPSQPEQPDDTENSDDEDDAPDTQTGEVPDRVKQMYEAMGVITHLDGTQELGDVTTAEYDPVNKVLSFDAHGTVFRMTGDSLRELAKEVHELRIRFLDGNGQEMEAVIPLARIKDLVGVNGAFELELSQEGLYRFHVVGQTGYDRKTFSDETALRINGRELVLVYRVGDEEQKAQETARVEEAIARRKQEKKQWGTVLSGLEGSLSGQPELTQPGTGTVGGVTDSIADPKVTDMGSITVRLPGKSAPDQTVWKTVTGNIVKFVSGKQDVTHDDSADIVKLVSGKQDDKQEDPAPSVGDLSGLQTLSPDSLTTVQQPEAIAQQPETGAQQPETGTQQPEVRGWVKDSQGKWVWRSGQESAQQPDWKPNKWVRLHDYFPWDPFYDSAYWETRKWRRVSQPPDSAWWDPSYDSAWMYDYEG